MSEPGGQIAGRHIGEIFFQRAAELGDRTFIKLQKGDRFEEVSWRQFAAIVQKTLLGLVALGLAPGAAPAIGGTGSRTSAHCARCASAWSITTSASIKPGVPAPIKLITLIT